MQKYMEQERNVLGDTVEKTLAQLRIDRLVAAYEKRTKKKCNCGARKEALNNAHRKINKIISGER
jgi:hypothetical protein